MLALDVVVLALPRLLLPVKASAILVKLLVLIALIGRALRLVVIKRLAAAVVLAVVAVRVAVDRPAAVARPGAGPEVGVAVR